MGISRTYYSLSQDDFICSYCGKLLNMTLKEVKYERTIPKPVPKGAIDLGLVDKRVWEYRFCFSQCRNCKAIYEHPNCGTRSNSVDHIPNDTELGKRVLKLEYSHSQEWTTKILDVATFTIDNYDIVHTESHIFFEKKTPSQNKKNTKRTISNFFKFFS